MRKFLFWVTDQTEIISTCLKQISFLKMLSMMQLKKSAHKVSKLLEFLNFPGNRSAREKCGEFCAGILCASLEEG